MKLQPELQNGKLNYNRYIFEYEPLALSRQNSLINKTTAILWGVTLSLFDFLCITPKFKISLAVAILI